MISIVPPHLIFPWRICAGKYHDSAPILPSRSAPSARSHDRDDSKLKPRVFHDPFNSRHRTVCIHREKGDENNYNCFESETQKLKLPLGHSQTLQMWTLKLLTAGCTESPWSFDWPPRITAVSRILDIASPN